LRVAPLVGHIYSLVAEGIVADTGSHRPRCQRKAAVLLRSSLHGRPRALTLIQGEVVAHPDLVAVLEHRRARQREEKAEGDL
jgi:hypothetical protein